MKPYYRGKPIRFPNKRDCHPKKGFINWWEDISEWLSRRTIKQRIKKDIDYEDTV